MTHLLDSISISSMGSTATDMLTALGPLLALFAGLLLAIGISTFLIGIFFNLGVGKKEEDDDDEE
jgi:hypothetical protein